MAASKQLLSEFLGTFLLVFTVSCHVLNEAPDTTFVALSIASVLMITVYAMGPVSGANFNPAVTLAITLSKKKEWTECLHYVISQLAGALCASVMACLLWGNGEVHFGPPFDVIAMLSVFLVEAFYTAMLCFVVLSTACVEKSNQYFGLAIGFVIVAGGSAGGWVSGGAFNPAVALGINMSAFFHSLHMGWFVFYWAAECIGACIAAALFAFLRPGEFEGDAKGQDPGEVELGKKLVAEALGTCVLVVTVGLNVLKPAEAANPDAILSIAASLLCMVYALGPVSGAHLNPAVTVAVALRKGPEAFPSATALAYIAAQLGGGIFAGLAYFTMSAFHSFPLGHPDGYPVVDWPLSGSWFGVALAEFTFTFLLAYVVLATATVSTPAAGDMFGLAIGFAVVAGAYAISPISGGSLNPAVSVAIDLTHLMGFAINNASFHSRFWHCAVYSAFELLGGVLAAVVFSATHPEEGYTAIEENKSV